MCAMISKLYDWDLRNIAKIDQMTMKYVIWYSKFQTVSCLILLSKLLNSLVAAVVLCCDFIHDKGALVLNFVPSDPQTKQLYH